MQPEYNERIRSGRSQGELLDALEMQFKKVAKSAVRAGQVVEVKEIESSVFASSAARVSVQQNDGSWLVSADVDFQASLFCWIVAIIGLFTGVLWILVVVVFLHQKSVVSAAIKGCLERVKNEFDQPGAPIAEATGTAISDLEKLAALKERGLVTEAEFQAKKKQLLGL